MKVLFLTFIPSPYRLSFFEELSKYCELTVLFERAQSKYRKGKWHEYKFNGYKGIIMKGITLYKQDCLCFEALKYVCDKQYDIVILSNPLSPTGFLAATAMKLKGIHYIVECDGAFPTHRRNWKTKFKGYVMRGAKLCMSTAKYTDEYYQECGVLKDKLVRYPFTSISENDIIKEVISKEQQQKLRLELSIPDKFSVITIGRFIPLKGFDVLIKSAQSFPMVNFYFIGGTPTEEYRNLVSSLNLKNVFFLDFMPKNSVLKWLKACDLFVLPTRSDVWGLVINEAMACGLPVISTDRCIAALEMIEDGVNGYVVKTDNVETLSEKIGYFVNSIELTKKMGNNALNKARKYTFKTMADAHMKVFNELN